MQRTIRLTLVAFVVFGGWATIGGAEVISLAPSSTALDFEGGQNQILHLQVSEVRLDRIEIAGAEWAVVRVPGAHNLMDRGLPSWPYLGSEYLLGRTGGIEFELVDVKLREISLDAQGVEGVAPSKGHFDRTIDPDSVPWVFDDKVYEGTARFPIEDVWVARPHIAGPLRGQALRFPVAHWQPETNTLLVVEEAWFRVVAVTEADNPRIGPDRPLTGVFDAAARLRAANYDDAYSRYVPVVETGRLVIIAADDFVDEVTPFAEWQTLVGYPTLLVSASTAGGTAAQIKTYIQSLYDAPEGLTWIILVGDAQQIPTLTGVNEGADCDPCFTKLEGADNRPDAVISRISAQTGEQVTVQVNKILDYERLPDTGSAAAWYAKAFGVAGDDTGGSPSYSDWARMDFLRDDLLEPEYVFTEFDQLYHYPSKAEVAASVNAGKSVGFYIGHGSKTSWVTSGFNVTDVNNMLTNSETLPIIWSVACVNGDFTGTGDCFAEAWLKKDGGGGVSFEGATTNESWVPPCNAQRGVVDSIRNEIAFTTGGQHVNGKLYCLDVDGEGNNDEGTRFMEQSTLFGAATMWPRTQEPQFPDEPDDFVVAGGTATLTLKVAGTPFTKVGGAIVSFYNESGGINVVGSGLVDASGVVTAAVTGDPTHCHIHGQNLVPMSFELAAREEGRVALDAGVYACAGTVTVRVVDSNIPGTSPAAIDTTTVDLSVGGSPYTVTLTETAADRNIFSGTAVLGTNLAVAHGDTLVATYIDVNDGAGGTNVPRTSNAAIDCTGPVLSNLEVIGVGATSATVRWTTDEPGDSWAQINPGGAIVSATVIGLDHELTFEGLDQCTEYTIAVASADAFGNSAVGGPTDSFLTLTQSIALEDDVESGPGGWTAVTVVDPGSGTNWSIVTDSGTSSPTHAWFTSDESSTKDDRLKAGPFVIGGGSTVLSFWHHFDTEGGYDGGVLEVSVNGTAWQDVVAAGGLFLAGGYNDTASGSSPITGRPVWAGTGSLEQVRVDLSALAGTSTMIRFRFACDGSASETGWWVDDILLETSAPCETLFSDGFEIGSCGMWGLTVGEN